MQQKKHDLFRALHHSNVAFIMPNAWDAGTARILASIGFSAIATTSAGYAFATGRRDSEGGLTRAEILDNAEAIAKATDLPVSADLEDGFGARPQDCAVTIRQAVARGLVGGSIEDATGDADRPIREFGAAVACVAAAAEAARDQRFVLTARAENFICGNPDLKDTVKRLQAFSEAGADVLYAPGLPDIDAIRTVCRELDKPVNVLMGLQGKRYSVAELSEAGVKRISIGGSFARAALGAVIRAAREVFEDGTFDYAADAVPDATIRALMSSERPEHRR
ncbi:isocitrate lyase/PEP mutase family protein [Albidovulum aquaemixtae]|nr:isocitrate lyase/phosphoenolpyruvate mutase family protein [Defluviimonas aquaemixtae]